MLRIAAFLLALVFFPIFLISLFVSFFSVVQSPETRTNGANVYNNINISYQYVRSFQNSHQRLPEASEFASWANEYSNTNKLQLDLNVRYHKTDFPPELLRIAGAPPYDAFYFEAFNGDFYAYYPSWYKNGKIGLVPDNVRFFGLSLIEYYAILMAIILLTGFLSISLIFGTIFGSRRFN
jgi:hypothetical protein